MNYGEVDKKKQNRRGRDSRSVPRGGRDSKANNNASHGAAGRNTMRRGLVEDSLGRNDMVNATTSLFRDGKPNTSAHQDTTHTGIQQRHQHDVNNPNPRTSSGGGRSGMHPSSNSIMNMRCSARSNSKARQRKKKGTLVMRGCHEDVGSDVVSSCVQRDLAVYSVGGAMSSLDVKGSSGKRMQGRPLNRSVPRGVSGQHGLDSAKSTLRPVNESRDPPSSLG